MNILSLLRSEIRDYVKQSKVTEDHIEKMDKKIKDLQDKRDEALRQVETKWDVFERELQTEKEDSLYPLKEKLKDICSEIASIKERLLIARVSAQGNIYRGYTRKNEEILETIRLNFMKVNFIKSPPKGRREREELIVRIDGGWLGKIINKDLELSWDGTVMKKRFDIKTELTTYLRKNKDKILKPLYEEDNRLAEIASDEDYRRAVTKDYDMTMVWVEWSGETIKKLTKDKVIYNLYGENEVIEVTVSHVEGDTFKVKVEGSEAFSKGIIKSHLEHGIYFCNNPVLIFE